MRVINPHELVKDVQFMPWFDVDSLEWNEQYGFMQIEAADLAVDRLRFVGFSVPILLGGTVASREFVNPITEFSKLPAENQNIDQQGKGVGPRVHDTLQAVAGSRSRPEGVGVYTFDVNLKKILDLRKSQGGSGRQIASHAGKMKKSAQTSPEEVVAKVHESYGDADAVELNLPIHPRIRQKLHGVWNPRGVKPRFMIIRNSGILLHKVGEADAPW